jgi:arginase
MPLAKPVAGLRVVQVQDAGARPVSPDRWALADYSTSVAYHRFGVPLEIVRPLVPDEDLPNGKAHALGVINGAIAGAVAEGARSRCGVPMAGGRCHHATGVLGGLQDAHGLGVGIGLVWFDAHGDFNTPQTTLSGSLGGMPLAVCAGLAFPAWRESSHITAPLPTDRILLCDARNLDPPEEMLARAVGVIIAAPAPGFRGQDLREAVGNLARAVDMIYLHVDADILDGEYVPNHATREPKGPNMQQVLAAVDTVMATGKGVAYAVVSVYAEGERGDTAINSGIMLVGEGLASRQRHGMTDLIAQCDIWREALS